MLGMSKNTKNYIRELIKTNNKLKKVLRKVGSENFQLETHLKAFKNVLDVSESDTITTLVFNKNQRFEFNGTSIHILDSNIKQYNILNEQIKENDYIIFNIYNKKLMIRTSVVETVMFIADEIIIVLKEEAKKNGKNSK